MLNGKTVAVVVPAYNEETQIGRVIETMPGFVDRIIVVNDCSRDNTATIAKQYMGQLPKVALPEKETPSESIFSEADRIMAELNKKERQMLVPGDIISGDKHEKVVLINLHQNSGVGAAIAKGYKWAKDHHIDCTAVMAGDGQMDPAELESICRPVVDEGIDYVKGNRLIHRSANMIIPKIRFLGNSILSIFTKLASGYWHVSDTQSGFTAISGKALNAIELHKIFKSYGMPNDMLVKLNIAMCTIKEVEIKPIYNVGEKSKMKIYKVIPRVSCLLIKSFFKRLWTKYFFRDFHPLFYLYNMAFILFFLSIPFAIRILQYLVGGSAGERPILNSIMFMFLVVSASQSLLFAMWMDIQDNDRLYK